MTVTEKELRELIPHTGNMCLLDDIVSWDEVAIVCTSRTHLDPGNPLRSRGGLHAICGIEYAGQAMAAHGALTTARGNAVGYLASVRDVHLGTSRLDTVAQALRIEAVRLNGEASGAVYQFKVCAGDTELLRGRASVFLQSSGEQL